LGEFSGIAWGSLMQYFSACLWTKWAQWCAFSCCFGNWKINWMYV